MNEKTILIVDDADFLSKLIKARLQHTNLTVEQATNGQEALEFIKAKRVDLIILDLVMPVMTGFEFLEKASLNPSMAQVPVIILSNLSQDSDIEKVQRYGIKKYFVKAKSSLDEVVGAVQESLALSTTTTTA